MQSFINFAHQNPFLVSAMFLGLYVAFTAIAGGMPKPRPNSGMGYLWAFNTMQLLAQNIDRIAAARGIHLPGPNQTILTTEMSVAASVPSDAPPVKKILNIAADQKQAEADAEKKV
jgi:hypothetical protein